MSPSLRILHVIPFISPFLIFGVRFFEYPTELVKAGLGRYAQLAWLFGVWWLVRHLVLRYRAVMEAMRGVPKDSSERRSNKDLYLLIAIVVSAVLFLSLVQFVAGTSSDTKLHVLFVALGLSPISEILLIKRRDLFYFIVEALYVPLICCIMFTALISSWGWSTVVYGLAVAAPIVAADMAWLIPRSGRPEPHDDLMRRWGLAISRAYVILLFIGPCLIAFLCSYDHLPRLFLLSMVSVLFAGRLAKQVKNSSDSGLLPDGLALPSANIAILYFLVLVAVMLAVAVF